MCDGTIFGEVLNLGEQSLVNSYLKNEDIGKELLLPLVVHQCRTCGLVQVLDTVDPDEIYTKGKYLYFSKDVPGLKDYFEEYAADLFNRFLKKDDFVIEVASNDGILLDFLRSKVDVLGIDAAPNAVLKALKLGFQHFHHYLILMLPK